MKTTFGIKTFWKEKAADWIKVFIWLVYEEIQTLSERVQMLLSHLVYRRNKECKLSWKTARSPQSFEWKKCGVPSRGHPAPAPCNLKLTWFAPGAGYYFSATIWIMFHYALAQTTAIFNSTNKWTIQSNEKVQGFQICTTAFSNWNTFTFELFGVDCTNKTA